MLSTVPILQDLEDVRSTMLALDDVRAAEIEMDMELGPVEECYAFLQRCGVAVPREEMERVDSLRYTFKNLQSQAVSSNPIIFGRKKIHQSYLYCMNIYFHKDVKIGASTIRSLIRLKYLLVRN